MTRIIKMRIRAIMAGFALALVAACAAPPPPPPPPAPVAIPSRPLPPGGASPSFVVSPRDMYGIRQTVNTNLSGVQKSWNMRSAFTVAALNCLNPQHAGILPAYKSFIETHKAGLARINRSVEQEWKEKVGSSYQRARDTYTTQVYNYFAMPPILPRFCDVMNEIAFQTQTVTPVDLDVFAQNSLARIEAVFEGYFTDFEQYRIDLAAWDAQYGARYGQSQVQQVSANYYAPDTAGAMVQPMQAQDSYGPLANDGAAAQPGFGGTR